MDIAKFLREYQNALDEALAEYEQGTDEHIDEFHRTYLQELFAKGIEFGSKKQLDETPEVIQPTTLPRNPLEDWRHPIVTYGNGTDTE